MAASEVDMRGKKRWHSVMVLLAMVILLGLNRAMGQTAPDPEPPFIPLSGENGIPPFLHSNAGTYAEESA